MSTLNLVKYWKGQHHICVTGKIIDEHLKAMEHKRPVIQLDPACLVWEPTQTARKQLKQGKKQTSS
jgi:hypothetical protein